MRDPSLTPPSRIGIAAEWVGENVGGLERYAASLMRSLAALDADEEFEFFLTPRGRDSLSDLEGPRTRVRATASNSRWHYVPIGLPLIARKHPVDVMHATFTIAPWCPHKRLVFTVHDLCPIVHPEFFPAPIRARLRWLLSRGIAAADWIVVPSEATRRELTDFYTFPAERVSVIPHGVEGTVRQLDSELTPGDEAILRSLPAEFVLYVGRFHGRKNLDRLVEAMALLKDRQGGSVPPLVIAGRDLWGEKALRGRMRELKMESDIHFPGFVNDAVLARLYQRALLFAFPSLHEGFGIPILESMAHGVPVLTSNISSMPEVGGDAVHLIDPYDVDSLSHGIERLLGDVQLRETLIAAGTMRLSQFSWERSAAMHLEVYRHVVSEPRSA